MRRLILSSLLLGSVAVQARECEYDSGVFSSTAMTLHGMDSNYDDAGVEDAILRKNVNGARCYIRAVTPANSAGVDNSAYIGANLGLRNSYEVGFKLYTPYLAPGFYNYGTSGVIVLRRIEFSPSSARMDLRLVGDGSGWVLESEVVWANGSSGVYTHGTVPAGGNGYAEAVISFNAPVTWQPLDMTTNVWINGVHTTSVQTMPPYNTPVRSLSGLVELNSAPEGWVVEMDQRGDVNSE
jgi:hypothetical protein